MASNNECKHIFNDFITTMIGSVNSESEKNITLDYPVLYLSTWYHYENGQEQADTIAKMTDNLIVWALRETDPDRHLFMTSDEIYNIIEKTFPTAKNHIKSIFSGRLVKLQSQRTKKNNQQLIQKHKGNKYCLPLESREEYQGKYEESSQLLLITKLSFTQRLIAEGFDIHKSENLAELILHTIKHVFKEKGIRFAKTLIEENTDEYDEIYLRDAVKKANEDLKKYFFTNKELEKSAIILRHVFARPNKGEQEYLTRASHLYLMHYIMHNDIGITSYFKERTKRLSLIVHSDVLIRALSEHYLPAEGQHYRNMLKYLIQMEAELLITEESIMEIFKNLQIASYEYNNHIQTYEHHFTMESIKFLPVLMTRAYLYSLKEKQVTSWNSFIDNFCTPEYLYHKNNQSAAKEELQTYITDKFNLNVLRSTETESMIDTKLAEELTKELKPYKKKDELAKHVATVNLYVSAIRYQNKEITTNPYGYKTYWLTHEKTAYSHAKEFFNKNGLGTRIIMRPEFIMQQIQLTPNSKNIDDSYTATFPTALGIQMSQHLDINTFHPLMKKFTEIDKKDSSRSKVLLNSIIQVASEQTELVHDLGNYDTDNSDEYKNNTDIGNDLEDKLNKIIIEAEKRNQVN
jgi:hypothetical protein